MAFSPQFIKDISHHQLQYSLINVIYIHLCHMQDKFLKTVIRKHKVTWEYYTYNKSFIHNVFTLH